MNVVTETFLEIILVDFARPLDSSDDLCLLFCLILLLYALYVQYTQCTQYSVIQSLAFITENVINFYKVNFAVSVKNKKHFALLTKKGFLL